MPVTYKTNGLMLRCNGQGKPLLLDLSYGPFFSWTFGSDFPGDFIQGAYRIQVVENGGTGPDMLWDSGKVSSARQYMIPYAGKQLAPLKSYRFTIAVWDGDDRESFSSEGIMESGLSSDQSLFKGDWIGGYPMLRNEFELPGEVVLARAYATCVGYYELRINGKKAGDQVLAPSHTDYEKRVEYQAYDVTGMLKKGRNAVGLMLGGGLPAQYPFMVKEPYALVQIHIELKSGEKIIVLSGKNWSGYSGPIVENSVYTGEVYDARLERPGWDETCYPQQGEPVKIFAAPAGKLVPQILPPIRVIGEQKPVSVNRLSDGSFLVDFGQNLAGRVKITAAGPGGTAIKIGCSELINEDGTLNQKNLNMYISDTYIMKGTGREAYTPCFTYRGFRYARVEGYPGLLNTGDIIACIVHSDVDETGSFECADELYNRIHSAMKWTFLNNLHSIPTDCPQRSERRGWMADAHIASDALICNCDMHWFYRKWFDDMSDIVDEKTGEVTHAMAPRWFECRLFPWSAALFIIPWNLYRYYDDTDIIARNYTLLKKVLNFFMSQAGENGLILDQPRVEGFIPNDNTFDDWLAIDRTRNDQVINGFYYQEALIMAEFAGLLGFLEDSEEFGKLAETIKDSYNRQYLSLNHSFPEPNGYYSSAYGISQYSQALPLSLGMVPDEQRDIVFSNLIWDVLHERGDAQLTTGILGTKCLIDVLAESGRNDVVSMLFSRTDFPGWGFMLKSGATTIWERWQNLIGNDMNSHDHPALAAPDTWFFRHLAGISPAGFDADGRRIFRVAPYTQADMQYARGACRTPWGAISSDWEKKDGVVTLNVSVPPNTRADVFLNGCKHSVGGGKHRFECRY